MKAPSAGDSDGHKPGCDGVSVLQYGLSQGYDQDD